MFGTFRKHQTWLWAIIIAAIIVSFVYYFSPASKMNNSRSGPVNLGSINGERVSQEEFVNARREVYLQFFFRNGGRWPTDDAKKMGFDPERETYQWLLLIQKEEQLGIHIGSDVVAQVARNMLTPFQRDGVSSPAIFVEKVLQPQGLQVEDFERFVRHYLGIQELIATIGLSGELVTPQEAKALYEREHEELATEAVFFSVSNYLASVTATPEAISQFYSNRLANYRLPDQVQVSYVKFGISNLLAAAEAELIKTNLAEMIEANYQRLGTNYFRDAKTPEETKTKIREELIRGRALAEARKKALEFAGPLFDMKPVRAENLEALARTNGLKVGLSAPFDREDGPKDLEVNPDFLKAAFKLTPDEPFAGPLIGKDGAYVIALNKKIPSEIPPLDQIRARVAADYKYNQAMILARTAGVASYKTLTNGLTQGKSFSAICNEAKLKPVELPPFSLSTRSLPEVEDRISLDGRNGLKQIAFSTPSGQVSEFQATSDGGIIVYVKSRLPLDVAKMTAELPAFVASVRQNRQNEAFNEWFRKEMEKGLRDTPLARQQQPGFPSGSGKS
jgi:peptidyl-prolyl cis-trans isomerase D